MSARALPTAVFCCFALACGVRAVHAEDGLPAGWNELVRLDANAARDRFAAALVSVPSSREARFGLALALLNAQPRTESNLASARRHFETLRQADPDDDQGIGAAFYLARLQQVHGSGSDSAAVIAAYRALLGRHPGHPVAELAAPKLAILLLYDDVPAAVWEERCAEVTALLPRLKSAEARRDTRLVLADALIRLRRDHARAYPLISYCLAGDLVVRMPRLNALLLQAAASAAFLGRETEAAAYYTRYLALFPHDVKSPEVRARLLALPGEAGA